MMNWYQDDEEEDEDLMFSPALLARRASESWIVAPPVEVTRLVLIINSDPCPSDQEAFVHFIEPPLGIGDLLWRRNFREIGFK